MTKLPFKINTDITIQDLMNFAEFKLRFAEVTEDEETKFIHRTQAAELHMICDVLVKSAIGNTTGFNYLSAYEIPTLLSMDNKKLVDAIGITKKVLPAFSSLRTASVGTKFPGINIQEAKVIFESHSDETKEIAHPKLPFKEDDDSEPNLEQIARRVLEKGNSSDDEYVKMVKGTVIESIKQRGGRMEAVRFLRDYAFKSLNWSDTEAHSFINKIKEVEDIVEPKKKKDSIQAPSKELMDALRERMKKS